MDRFVSLVSAGGARALELHFGVLRPCKPAQPEEETMSPKSVAAKNPKPPVIEVRDDKATGIDVGSETMHVSIAGGTPQVFGTVTSQLQALRDYLLAQGVTSVALEATGVYWLCLHEVLTSAGISVLVVNGRHVKNLPGRKSDMSDCQWISTLHAHGLLRSGFVPPTEIRRLQDYTRLRQEHIVAAAAKVQHMQKALERMNLKVHDVISSLTGVSGLAMMRAIIAGERNPATLLALCDVQIRQKKAERLCEALRGTWREEHLFALRQALESWDFFQRQIGECDAAIAQALCELPPAAPPPTLPPAAEQAASGEVSACAGSAPTGGAARAARGKRGKAKKGKRASPNTPKIADFNGLLVRVCGGQDPTLIPAIGEYTLLQLIGEVGTDLSCWPTEKHFTSWLGLAPGTHQSGKRRGRAKTERNRAGRLFCVVARTLAQSVDKALGGFYRRLRARRGGLVANKALARKLAEMFWRVMVHGVEYVEQGLAKYEVQVQQTEHRALKKLAAKHGFALQKSTTWPEQVHG